RAACTRWPAATAAHLRPEPRINDGQLLAGLPGVRALMDVSDGLARDLPRLLGLGTGNDTGHGADLCIDEGLLHQEALEFLGSQVLRPGTAPREKPGESPVEFAVLGGEDYALLAGVEPAGLALVLAALPSARHIGRVSEAPGLRVNGAAFTRAGFDHFGQD
ncbi:MAG: thiamine-phosphate kinase, partial [Proteobacteria bacterium]|nr:thiamine-phosphate kinase [Pseudomonadota bacterium]MBU1595291.1 thiamine-phosphate kinase [Pseudomonadota bacterium]